MQRPVPVEPRGLGLTWWVTIVVTALVLLASVLYATGVPWVRIGLDADSALVDGAEQEKDNDRTNR